MERKKRRGEGKGKKNGKNKEFMKLMRK